MSFRHFVDAALYTEKGPPMNPTWFYTLSRACGYNAQLQVLSWLLVLVPLTGILWHLASSSSHILFIFNLRLLVRNRPLRRAELRRILA